MKTTRIGLMLTIAVLAQTTFVRAIGGTGAPVDLVLVVVVFAALSRGPVVGLWTGTLGGLVQDALSGGIIGVSGLAKSVVGVLVGVAASQFIIGTVWHRLLILLVASVGHAFCFLGVYALVGSAAPFSTLSLVLLQAVVNAVVGVGAEVVVHLIPGARQRVRQGRTPFGRRHWLMG